MVEGSRKRKKEKKGRKSKERKDGKREGISLRAGPVKSSRPTLELVKLFTP